MSENLLAILERRKFRRNSKMVVRALGVASKIGGMNSGVASRMNQVKSAFKAVSKRKIKDIPKQFDGTFKRKRRIRMKRYKKKRWGSKKDKKVVSTGRWGGL